MTVNKTENNALSQVDRAYLASLPSIERFQKGTVSKRFDTFSKSQEKAKGSNGLSRPELPSAKSELPAYLAMLSAAYVNIYKTMSKSLTSQIQDFSKLQELSMTMSKATQDATLNAVAKEEKQEAIAEKLENEQKKMAKEDKALSNFATFVGISLMVGTIALGFATGGAADAALPEEETAIAGAEASFSGAEAEGDIGMVDLSGSSLSDSSETEVGEETTGSTTNTAGSSSSVNVQESLEQMERNSQIDQIQQQTSEDLEKSNRENSKSSSKYKKATKVSKFIAKGLWGGAVSATLSLPQLVEGLQKIQLSKQEKALAKAQKETGAATAKIGKNEAYYQFYAQFLQKKETVIDQLAKQLSAVVQNYSTVTNAYQQISYGLARSV